ncbi:MAG: NAD(+) synthase, partial [Bacteroidales bacterium]|nr:NAD(+) synthase [Bacteroidales bacterium]
MKIHIVQHDVLTRRTDENLEWIKAELAASGDALLTVFPACTLCGAPLFAAAAYTDLQKRAQAALQELIELSEHRAFLVGMPLQIQDKGLCNAIVFVQNCAIRGVVTKKYLAPDEQKYFVRGEGVQLIDFHDQRIAIGFYEDLKELSKGHIDQPDMVICCGCNIFDYQKPYRTRYRMTKIVETLGASLVYVNRTGGEGPYLYAGGSLAMNAAGGVLCQLPYFEQACQTVDMQLIDTVVDDEKPEAVELVYKALVCGLRDYFGKNGLRRAVLGLSGGIDSALVATLAVDALGAENVHGLLMPSQYSTDHSVRDAEDLAHNLGMSYDIVPIAPMFEQFKTALKPVFGDRAEDVTEENLQARIRGTLVMSYANKFGALALNTTNRSEAAMGYGTLYGDSCGSLAVIADLYKTEVYQLSDWINRDGIRIPQNTIDKAPSAELRPGQKDSDSLPDYSVLDAILGLYLDEQMCEDEIVEDGYDRAVV